MDPRLGLILVTLAVVAIIAVNTRITRSESVKVTRHILERLRRVRLFRMLQKRRVDVYEYVEQTDVAKLREQIASCEACTSGSSCDAALASSTAVTRKDFSFCPNDPAIVRFKQRSRAGN